MSDVFDELDLLAGAGDLDAVERLANDALTEVVEEEDACDLWRYIAWARFERGRFQETLKAAQLACDPLYEAKALFHLWNLQGAQDALDRFEGSGDDAAEAEWYRACLCEFRGEDPAAHFTEANHLAPGLFPLPARLSEEEVDAVIHAAVTALPEPVRRALADSVVRVVPLPRPHPDVDPLTLGLYHGVSRLDRRYEDPPRLPAQVEIYRLNVERVAADRESAADELRITLLHELGHHLGFDEEGVEDLGLA